ncbi:MAG: hypothetical protein ACP5VS_09045 [Desulfomonilaceae bacterium]
MNKIEPTKLSYDQALDNLIELGYEVVDSDFDQIAFRKWRLQAIDCINKLLGPEHPYAKSFLDHVRNRDSETIFLVRGLIQTAKRNMLKKVDQEIGHTS